jgi:poly-gamma-glutamate biosynthesis protein PgsC/CapC
MTYETFVVGILLALIYVEVLEIYPGGIVVPAYVALHLDAPERVLVTILVALSSLAAYRGLSRYLILFGRRRFALLVLLGAFFSQGAALVVPGLSSGGAEIQLIGWIVPGLLANNLERQKLIPTLASLLTVSIMTYFVVGTLSWF